MTTAAQESTKAHGAVIATKPAKIPLTDNPGSGFLLGPNNQAYVIAETPPAAPAIRVLIAAMTARLRKAPVKPRDEPGLNPNQPKKRMMVPSTPSEML